MKFNHNIDPLFKNVAKLIVIFQTATHSLVCVTFKTGYDRAHLLMDQLEEAGIIGHFEGNKHRKVLVKNEHDLEQILKNIK